MIQGKSSISHNMASLACNTFIVNTLRSVVTYAELAQPVAPILDAGSLNIRQKKIFFFLSLYYYMILVWSFVNL